MATHYQRPKQFQKLFNDARAYTSAFGKVVLGARRRVGIPKGEPLTPYIYIDVMNSAKEYWLPPNALQWFVYQSSTHVPEGYWEEDKFRDLTKQSSFAIREPLAAFLHGHLVPIVEILRKTESEESFRSLPSEEKAASYIRALTSYVEPYCDAHEGLAHSFALSLLVVLFPHLSGDLEETTEKLMKISEPWAAKISCTIKNKHH